MLHGGASRGEAVPVSPTQLSVLRMVPTARAAAHASSAWPSTACSTPAVAGTPAARRCRRRLGDQDRARAVPVAPVGLIGHSLGGRAALAAGDDPAVRSVAALNPWVYPDDDFDLRGRRTLFVHGRLDRIAPPARSEAVARRVGRRTVVGFVRMPDGKHAMLRRGSRLRPLGGRLHRRRAARRPSLASGPVAQGLRRRVLADGLRGTGRR